MCTDEVDAAESAKHLAPDTRLGCRLGAFGHDERSAMMRLPTMNTARASRNTRLSTQGAEGLYNPRNEHDACGVGFIADLSARKSHKIIEDGLQILVNLTHRGAVGADPLAGDGAGMLIQIPNGLFRGECSTLGIDLPEAGDYAVGHVFMPRDKRFRRECEAQFENSCKAEGLTLLG